MSQRIKLYLDEDAQRTDLIQALRARQINVTLRLAIPKGS